jgi:signal transduction histidine kinase/ActR/RegA family two-component response regulator
MIAFRDFSFKRKLVLIIMMTSIAALLLASAAFAVLDRISLRSSMVQDLNSLADIIAAHSTAALRFNDAAAAEEILSALGARPHISGACVYSGNGVVLARYARRKADAATLPSSPGPPGIRFEREHLVIFHKVLLNGEQLGTIYIESDMNELNQRMRYYAGIASLVLLASIGVAYMVSGSLQRIITVPIQILAAAAKRVSTDRDYSLRVAKQSDDELGLLTEAFNEMLAQIQSRDKDLQRAHDDLERRVDERTLQLRLEIKVRLLAEDSLRQEKALVELLQVVVVAANEASNVEDALRICLDRICAHIGWPVGHVYLMAENGTGLLVPTRLWHIGDPEKFASFRRITESMPLASGTGLPGRVLASGKAIWINDVTKDPQFHRGKSDDSLGVRAGFAFPVLIGKEVVGVLEFYSPLELKPDLRLLDAMALVGTQIGRVIERSRSEVALRESEEQLRHSQKMEAVGTLAGGVAHDFNNILTGILGHAELLKSKSKPGDTAYRAAEIIEKAGRRAADLTRQLLGFARKGKHQTIPVDVHATIKEVIGLLFHTIDKKISITLDIHATQALLLGDPGQIQQVILNLAVNARDAMPDGGSLLFKTEMVTLDEEYHRKHPDVVPGRYLELTITDTGHGIPREVMGRIFEPFYTTKEPGKGTGMGLAMVYGIVRNHGGSIEVKSEVGTGTTFTIHLPMSAQTIADPEVAVGIGATHGSGNILIVDDEEVVRNLSREFLSSLGYSVALCIDGQEAVDYYATGPKDIDLVLIDMVMPRMNGRDCFRHLKKINPAVKAILLSGYGLNATVQEAMDEGMFAFIEKPYQLNDLSEVVARALQPTPAAA